MTWSGAPEATPGGWQRVRRSVIGLMLPVAGIGWSLWPTSSAWGSLAWLALCLAGLASLGLPDGPLQSHPADRRWWLATLAAFVVAVLATLGWRDPVNNLQDNARLMLAAGAGLLLYRALPVRPGLYRALLHASAVAAAVALLVAFTHERDDLPVNAIPWALSVSFLACLLAPAALDPAQPRGLRGLWALGTALALAAVLASQTRGALVAVPWLAWLLLRQGLRAHGWHRALRLMALPAAALALCATAWLDADPLRLRLASQDVGQALLQGNPDTAVGARLYMWRTALEGILQSPWWGHGIDARKAAMSALAARHDPAIWSELWHFHNEYLNAWYDHGLPGLGVVLLTLAGMVWAARALPPAHGVARQQLLGLAWMHGLAGLSNVNTAHNLYTLALGLAVALALLGAATRPVADAGANAGATVR